MNCKVQPVYKNLRYRRLTIGQNQYILDMSQSFLRILFPFFFWMLPNRVFRVDDQDIVDKLQTPEVKQFKTGWGGVLFVGGASGLLVKQLYPLLSKFVINSPPIVNSVILIVSLSIILLLYIYLNKRFKKNLCNVIELNKLSKQQLWIRPHNVKHIFQVLLIYLVSLTFTLFIVMFIRFGDIFLLLGASFFFLLFLFGSFMAVPIGNTTVKFKENKRDNLNRKNKNID